MTRPLLGLSIGLALLVPCAPVAAQALHDDASATEALEQLRHQSEELTSGLGDVRRSLLGIGLRDMDPLGAARLELTFEDHFGGLAPVSATFALDGARVFASSDPAVIERGFVFSGAIPSGPHVLTLELRYRGDVLYTTGFHTTLTSSYSFGTSLGRTTRLRVIGHDTSLFAAPRDRWTVDFAATTDPAE